MPRVHGGMAAWIGADASMLSATNNAGQALANFFSPNYQAHNRACLTHLESLGLPLSNRRVLELGSGPGDHTEFYVRRQCRVVAVDARQDCLDVLKQRHPGVQTVLCDLNAPARLHDLGPFDVIHCYGILYHLEDPSRLLAYMGEACSGLAIVQTCVLGDKGRRVDLVEETVADYTQSSTGRGCRPTREWVYEELGRFFPCVYHTRTQPNHPEFPVDWNALGSAPPLIRSIFVASKHPLDVPTLSPELLDVQERLDPKAYIAELESILAERLAIMQERDQLIRRLHDEAAVLRAAAEERLGEMHRKDGALAELKKGFERRTAKLERIVAERLEALEAVNRESKRLREEAERRAETIRDLERLAAERLNLFVASDRAAAEARAEAKRREAELMRIAAERLEALEAASRESQRLREEAERRAETIRDLEQVAAERLTLLVANDRAAAEARAEAERREAALRELTGAIQERDRRLEELEGALERLEGAH